MSDSIKARLEAAARMEPAVGDPYTRFVKRRRLSRAFRTATGFVLALVTMIGFVKVFPGVDGGTPDDGIFPNEGIDPGLTPFRQFEAANIGVRMYIPENWKSLAEGETARIGPDLRSVDQIGDVEIRFGDLGACKTEPCWSLSELVSDRAAAKRVGLRVDEMSLQVGSVRVTAHQIEFPAKDAGSISPNCPGCVGFYSELGTEGIPMLVLASDMGTMSGVREIVDLVLETVRVV